MTLDMKEDAGLGKGGVQEYFYRVAREVNRLLHGEELSNLTFQGEDSDFVRFNRGAVRQAGHVTQRELHLDLIRGRRHAAGTLTLAARPELDAPGLARLVEELRERLGHVPEDPYLSYAKEPRSGERVISRTLPEPAQAIDEIRQAGRGRDLVGIFASGHIYAGFANSLGQRNWYANSSFNLDWSFYHERDKAVKAGYAGFEWRSEELDRKVRWAAEQLEVLRHPARTIPPGRYRAYLAPTALYEIVNLLAWDAFSCKAHRTRQTPLLRLVTGDAALSPAVTVTENTAEGVAPNFQDAGFLRPDRVVLIDKGAYRDCLVSPRSGAEFGIETNGAGADEAPLSVDVAAGSLAAERVLPELGSGLYINNLWYLNYSDRAACRTTGMTRFATFWVEGGRIVAPLDVMRFDETVFRMLGEGLQGLTAQREMILDAQTYYRRSTSSARLPGALVDGFTLTL